MTFDEWMKVQNPKYQPTDDGEDLRVLRDCWQAARAAERERCKGACTKIARAWRGANSQALDCVNAIRALGDEI